MSLVLGLGLEHSCLWPKEGLSSEGHRLGFFCVLGLEPCVLDSTSAINHLSFGYARQEWQYGTFRICVLQYVPRTLNRIVPACGTSVQFLKHTVPPYRTYVPYLTSVPSLRTVPPYRISVPHLRTVPAYRTSVQFLKRTVLRTVPCFFLDRTFNQSS